jgi:predicted kinase
MRTLLVLRGAPGCGKSTWVEKNGLLPYTLCPDTLRIMCSSRELQADGRFSIERNNATEKQPWRLLWICLNTECLVAS